jgi:hypothetical protein
LLDPDPHSICGSGSRSRRAKITTKINKNLEFSCFEVSYGIKMAKIEVIENHTLGHLQEGPGG